MRLLSRSTVIVSIGPAIDPGTGDTDSTVAGSGLTPPGLVSALSSRTMLRLSTTSNAITTIATRPG